MPTKLAILKNEAGMTYYVDINTKYVYFRQTHHTCSVLHRSSSYPTLDVLLAVLRKRL